MDKDLVKKIKTSIHLTYFAASEKDEEHIVSLFTSKHKYSAEYIINHLTAVQKMVVTCTCTNSGDLINTDDKKVYIKMDSVNGKYIFQSSNSDIKPFYGNELFGKFRYVVHQDWIHDDYIVYVLYQDYIAYSVDRLTIENAVRNNTDITFSKLKVLPEVDVNENDMDNKKLSDMVKALALINYVFKD
jgi:hypothetical protein